VLESVEHFAYGKSNRANTFCHVILALYPLVLAAVMSVGIRFFIQRIARMPDTNWILAACVSVLAVFAVVCIIWSINLFRIDSYY